MMQFALAHAHKILAEASNVCAQVLQLLVAALGEGALLLRAHPAQHCRLLFGHCRLQLCH